ncbi:MAG: DUF1934 domain-containing protein [Oscillospiraceae bacterium]|nr:DUF1934 domain-containing protein [Oscillospiraceae bacterium]
MKPKYLITIDGLQITGWDSNITLTTLGDYCKDKDKYYISYLNFDEYNQESDTTILEVEADRKVVFSRSGSSSTHMIIERDRKNFSHFRTERGDGMFGIKASEINNNLGDTGGRLSLSYAMDMNANEVFKNNLVITVKEVTEHV